MKALVKEELEKILNKDIVLESPKDKNLGHFATTIAFNLAKELKKSPSLIADDIVKQFCDSEFFVLSAKNGYINVHLKKEFLSKLSCKALKDSQNFAKGESKKDKILLEYISANPTGPLHIGHVRGAVYGDTLARVGRHLGHDITTEYYINDAGNQIDLLGASVFYQGQKEILNLDPKESEGLYKGEYIVDLAREICDEFGSEIFKDEQNISKLSVIAKDKMLTLIKQNLKDANISIQNWVSEKELYKDFDKTLEVLWANNGVYKKDEKLWIKSSSVADEKDRVIVREDGRATYLAGDLIYHFDKFKREFDHYINIWGADHHGYIARVKAGVHFLGFDEAKLEVILAQMVSLLKNGETFKMSKRSGNFILMSDVISEIGSDALRYIFISKKCDTSLEFDVDKLKVQDSSNPIFYINYAHARINQVFLKANKSFSDVKCADFSSISDEGLNLVFLALTLDDVLADAFSSRSLQKIPDYLKNLSSAFHKFYNENRVIGSQNEDALLKIFAVVALSIKTALSLMGIQAKDKMEK